MSNSGVDHVMRFPAADPSKVENFKVGFNSSGLAIDSLGNVWVTNRFGSGLLGMAHLIDMGIRLKLMGVAAASDYLTKQMSEQRADAQCRQRHAAAPGRHSLSRLALHRRRPARAMGRRGGRKRQRLDLEFRLGEQPDRAALRRPHRELSARNEDRRPDFAARRLCRRRP